MLTGVEIYYLQAIVYDNMGKAKERNEAARNMKLATNTTKQSTECKQLLSDIKTVLQKLEINW